jgi:hypothetical protein
MRSDKRAGPPGAFFTWAFHLAVGDHTNYRPWLSRGEAFGGNVADFWDRFNEPYGYEDKQAAVNNLNMPRESLESVARWLGFDK